MKTIVLLPGIFQRYAGTGTLKIEGNTAGEVLENLIRQHSSLKKHIYSNEGRLRSVINVYLNDEDIKFLDDEKTIIKEDDVIKIIPSVTGGG